MPIQMNSSETDFDIVYLFGIPNLAKNIDVNLKAVVLLFLCSFFNRRRLVLKSTILLRISKGSVVFVMPPSSCYEIRM